MHYDQEGFVPTMQIWHNIQKPINMSDHVTQIKILKPHDYLNRHAQSIKQNSIFIHNKKLSVI